MDRVFRPFRLQPPLVVPKLNRLFLRAYRHDQPAGCRTHSAGFRSTSLGLRLSPAGSPRRQAESSSCSSGLVIHLPMLSTSRCREAVSFGYRTRFRPDGDSHPAGSIHLQTHWRKPPGLRMEAGGGTRVHPRTTGSMVLLTLIRACDSHFCVARESSLGKHQLSRSPAPSGRGLG
jgi:hypothetical protein